MNKFPIFIQDENYSCGAYCIKMILKYFKMNEEIDLIKQHCKLTHQGITMYGLIECLKYYHIESGGYEVSLEYLKEHFNYPCILHVVKEGMQHYIVLYKISKGRFICADPAIGLVEMTLGELQQIYQNKAVVITFVSKPIETNNLCFFRYYKQLIQNNITLIRQILLVSCIITGINMFINYLFKTMIDTMGMVNSMTKIIFLVVFLCMLVFVKLLVELVKNKMVVVLEDTLNYQIILKTLSQLLNLPSDYYLRYLRNDTSLKTQSLFELPNYIIQITSTLFIDGLLVIGLIIILFSIDIQILMVVLSLLILIVICSYQYLKKIELLNQQLMGNYQNLTDQGTNHILFQNEILNLGLQQYNNFKLKDKFLHFNTTLYNSKIKIGYYKIIIGGLILYLNLLVLLIGGIKVSQAKLSFGSLMLVYMVIGNLIEPFIRFSEYMVESKRMGVIFERLKTLKVNQCEFKEFDEPICAIAFKNVRYSYGYKSPILEYVDEIFTTSARVCGDNGSGKTTFLKLLSGQLVDYEGTILINHRDLKTIDYNKLKTKIGFLSSNTHIFDMNILQFLLQDHEDMQPFLFKLIHQYEFKELSDLCYLNVDKQGEGISQGQKQLIAFIRMMIINYDVYIFDESFSHLSEGVKEKITKILNSDFFKHKLVFIVDHQINLSLNIKNCVIISDKKVKIERIE